MLHERFFLKLYQSTFVLHYFRPNTGMSQFEEERNDLLLKYEKITVEDAGLMSYHIILALAGNVGVVTFKQSEE